MAVLLDVPVLLVVVHATQTAIIPLLLLEVDVRVLLVAPHVLHIVRIPPIIQVDVLDLHVALLVAQYVKTLLVIPLEDAQVLHVQDNVKADVLPLVPKHVQAIVPKNVAMDVQVTVEMGVRTLVREAADDSAAFLVVAHAAENVPQDVPHNA